MKMVAVWVVLALVAFGGAGGGLHAYLSGNPERVAIIIDSSFDMKDQLERAIRTATALSKSMRYAEFALFSQRSRIHSFESRLQAYKVNAFGPRLLDKLERSPLHEQVHEADHVYLITNAPQAETAALPSAWHIINPAQVR